MVPTTYAWVPTAAGSYDWNNAANWTVVSGSGTTFPNAQDDVAEITSALTGAETINLNTTITVGTLDIGASSGTNAFTIAPNGGSLTLSASSGTANVSKTFGGADQITAPLTFASNVEFDNSLSAPNTLAITSATTGSTTLTVNAASETGEVDFTAPAALSSVGAISVDSGVLGINSITLTYNRTITISAGANVTSFGTIFTTADPSDSYNVHISGGGTLNLTSTTNNATTSPDIYFNYNDANNNANWGTSISANINLGIAQRYFWGKDNHDSYGNFGASADAYLSGAISGSGGISFIAQNSYQNQEVSQTDFVLAGANTFSGELEIQRGAVYLANPIALSENNALVLDPAAGFNAWFYLYGNSTTVSNLQSSGAGTSIIADSSGYAVGPATLTVLETSNTTYAGIFADIQGDYAPDYGPSDSPLSVAETGAGTLTLTGTNSISGSVTVDPSTLTNNAAFTAANGFEASTGSTLAGTGTYNGNVIVDAGGSLASTGTVNGSTVTVNAGGSVTSTGTITGGLYVSGTMDPGGPSATSILNAGGLNLYAGAAFDVELNGTTPGTGYDQVVVNQPISLGGATLDIVSINASQLLAGVPLTIINNTTPYPVSATFVDSNGNPLAEGATVTAAGINFTISYAGGPNGDSVTLTEQAANTIYVESDWSSLYTNGQTIPDADPVAPGNQPAVYGTTAFSTVTAALAAPATEANSIIVVNGINASNTNVGTYNENVVVTKAITLELQGGPISFNSLSDATPAVPSSIGLNGISLTLGADNLTTTYSGLITGSGSLVWTGTSAFTLDGDNTFSGGVTIGNGTVAIGNTSALGSGAVTVDSGATLDLNGNSLNLVGLNGAGTVDNNSATPVALTVSAAAGTTFAGTISNTGTGALSLFVTGSGDFTLSGDTSTYTGSTTVGAGTELSFDFLALGGNPSSIGASTNAASNLVLDAGTTLDYAAIGSTTSTDRGLTLNGGATIQVDDAGSMVTFGGSVSAGGNATGGSGGYLIGQGGNTLTTAGAGTVVFSSSNALATTGNILVNNGTLSINSLTVSQYRLINIASGAFVESTGELSTTADGSVNPNYEVIGSGTLELRSPNSGVNNPDIDFNSNDAEGSTANWGTAISANIDLGSSQRYFTGQTNHNGFGVYGASTDAYITGNISGSGGMTFVGMPTGRSDMEMPFVFTGTNTFTGPVIIDRGSVYLDSPGAFPAVTMLPSTSPPARATCSSMATALPSAR